MLTREDDIDVHALRRQGWTITAIARQVGGGRAPTQHLAPSKRRLTEVEIHQHRRWLRIDP